MGGIYGGSLQPVRGMRDFGPDEALVRRQLLGLMEDAISGGGLAFKPVELPRMEHLSLLRSQIVTDQGERVAAAGENQKLIFPVLKRGDKYTKAIKAIKDGNEELPASEGLIFDHTLSLLRYHVKAHGKGKGDPPKEPFRYYQVGSVFRAERPQDGRYRQFTQLDLDIIYGYGPQAGEHLKSLIDVIIINVVDKVFRELAGMSKPYIFWNSAEIAANRFKRAGVPDKYRMRVAKTLDKYHKIGSDETAKRLKEEHNLDTGCINILLDDSLETKKKDVEGSTFYRSLGIYSKDFGVSFYDPFLLRGMNYYSEYMFELLFERGGPALGGGGSYDGLAKKLFGAEWGGIGFSFGFERIYDSLKEKLGIDELKKRLEKMDGGERDRQ